VGPAPWACRQQAPTVAEVQHRIARPVDTQVIPDRPNRAVRPAATAGWNANALTPGSVTRLQVRPSRDRRMPIAPEVGEVLPSTAT
jgi:hypothetical protein